MKVTTHYSLAHANKVLAIVRKLLAKQPGLCASDDVTVRVWANGREQGYHLSRFQNAKQVVFAQTRSGESITVIVGGPSDFCMMTNQPTEQAWKTGTTSWEVDEHAAKVIVDHLTRMP